MKIIIPNPIRFVSLSILVLLIPWSEERKGIIEMIFLSIIWLSYLYCAYKRNKEE